MAFTERWLHCRGRLQGFSAELVLFRAKEAGFMREKVLCAVTIMGSFENKYVYIVLL